MKRGSVGAFDCGTPRSEELIVDIYRQRSLFAESSIDAERVVISIEHYRVIQEYHARLGEVPAPGSDYIDKYRLFDLEICIEEIDWPCVEGPAERWGSCDGRE